MIMKTYCDWYRGIVLCDVFTASIQMNESHFESIVNTLRLQCFLLIHKYYVQYIIPTEKRVFH